MEGGWARWGGVGCVAVVGGWWGRWHTTELLVSLVDVNNDVAIAQVGGWGVGGAWRGALLGVGGGSLCDARAAEAKALRRGGSRQGGQRS